MIRDRKQVATCVGFGPRFLHSTGQAYKGGPNTGVFVGYIATAASAATADCVLQVERNSELDATYVDPIDSTDAPFWQVVR